MADMDAPKQAPAVELRIEILGTEPPIWRRVVLPESATVAELHATIQTAFGWKDYHLYGVRGVDRQGVRRIIIGTDDDGVQPGAELAADVGLLELIDPARPGKAPLEYEYDFGDSWIHGIEVVGPAALPENTVACLDGAMRGPLEDSGGAAGYANVVAVLGNPGHPEHGQSAKWFELVTPQRATDFDPTDFDLVAVNGQLRQLARRMWPGDATPEDRETVLGPVLWFLNAAHPDGLELTSAGYLKPAIVKRAMTQLGWDVEWPMPGRNENNVVPILDLREQLQDWKLLRKFKGKLVLTPAGRHVVQDPAALWDYLAERLAFPQHGVDKEVMRLLVHWAVSGEAPSYNLRREVIQSALHAKGYRMPGGAEIPLDDAWHLDLDNSRALRCLALRESASWIFRNSELSDGGLKFLLDVQRRFGDRSY